MTLKAERYHCIDCRHAEPPASCPEVEVANLPGSVTQWRSWTNGSVGIASTARSVHWERLTHERLAYTTDVRNLNLAHSRMLPHHRKVTTVS